MKNNQQQPAPKNSEELPKRFKVIISCIILAVILISVFISKYTVGYIIPDSLSDNNLELARYRVIDQNLTSVKASQDSKERTDYINLVHASLEDNLLTDEEYCEIKEMYRHMERGLLLSRLKGQ